MKKPDRWEREVAKLLRQYSSDDVEGLCPLVDIDEVAKLLRKEHAWVERMVRKLAEFYRCSPPAVDALADVVLHLKERAQ